MWGNIKMWVPLCCCGISLNNLFIPKNRLNMPCFLCHISSFSCSANGRHIQKIQKWPSFKKRSKLSSSYFSPRFSDANRMTISIVLLDTFTDGDQISKSFFFLIQKKPVHEEEKGENLGGVSSKWEMICASERDGEIEAEREEKRSIIFNNLILCGYSKLGWALFLSLCGRL